MSYTPVDRDSASWHTKMPKDLSWSVTVAFVAALVWPSLNSRTSAGVETQSYLMSLRLETCLLWRSLQAWPPRKIHWSASLERSIGASTRLRQETGRMLGGRTVEGGGREHPRPKARATQQGPLNMGPLSA